MDLFCSLHKTSYFKIVSGTTKIGMEHRVMELSFVFDVVYDEQKLQFNFGRFPNLIISEHDNFGNPLLLQQTVSWNMT